MTAIAACSVNTDRAQEEEHREPFGVFLGADREDLEVLKSYDTVVIESETFSREDITELHDAGCFVYGYLDIGTLEEYRDYYDEFEDIALDVYDDWPDERWIDASSPRWQEYVVNTLAPAYLDKGFDGFFLDNCDVYYYYPSDEMFEGLVAILQGLKLYDISLMVNGGNDFVMRCVDEGLSDGLIDAVNQETVFTSINFDDGSYGVQPEAENLYYREYIEAAAASGIDVFVTEYSADGQTSSIASEYYASHGFTWYNAPDLYLDVGEYGG